MRLINSFSGNYRFLSNFYLFPIVYITEKGSWTFPSVEHMFQALKTTDIVQFELIRNARTPGEAKRLGKTVALREGWEEWGREIVMLHALRLKFNKEPMRKLLLSTENAVLVEGNNWHDNFWGNCSCQRCIGFYGQNKLGEMLMTLREEIKKMRLNKDR